MTDNIKDLSLADVIFLSTSSRLICLKMNLVPLSNARKRISLLSTVNNLSTMRENCGYRHSPSQQKPLGTLLRGKKIIQGQVLPFQIKIPSDFRVFSDQDCKPDIANRDNINTCVQLGSEHIISIATNWRCKPRQDWDKCFLIKNLNKNPQEKQANKNKIK